MNLVRKKRFGLLELAIAVFAFSVVFVAKADVWGEAYSFGRTMSPLLIWCALLGVSSRSFWMLAPLALCVPRIAQQILTISLPIARGLWADATTLVR